jgi:hypothetical protein
MSLLVSNTSLTWAFEKVDLQLLWAFGTQPALQATRAFKIKKNVMFDSAGFVSVFVSM